ncbi:hypothetical protein [Streptomyces sp. URMC 123]|uniref:hypothetical protein n=1 Tax=Streptomyces sp. URMC 123 TaxID=3423403 RepID=UPI003F1B5A51
MTSFETEWNRLKHDAGADSSMKLAGAPGSGGGGGGAGGVKSSKAAWTKAGSDVGLLAGTVKKSLTGVDGKQQGLGAASGVQSAAAQRELYASWKRYLEGVTGKCDAIKERLEKAGNAQYKNDEAIKADFDALKNTYKDTPDVGGQDKGR